MNRFNFNSSLRGNLLAPSASLHSTPNKQDDERCNDVLRTIGLEIGLGAVEFDANRCCWLKFDEVLLSLHAPQGAWLFITTSLFILRRPLPVERLAEMLQANLYGKETGGAALAYDPQTDAALLQDRLFKQTLSAPQLHDRITAIVAAAESWRNRFPPDQIIALQSEVAGNSKETR